MAWLDRLNISKPSGKTVGVILLLTFIFLFPAIINNYPTATNDANRNLMCAYMHLDQPNNASAYSNFLRFISLGFTLWTVPIFQCLLFVVTLFMLFKRLFTENILARLSFTVILMCFTAYPWFLNSLHADAFLLTIVASIFILLISKKIDFIFIFNFLVIAIFTATHKSYFYILIMSIVVFLVVKMGSLKNFIPLKNIAFVFGALFISLLVTMPLSNKALFGTFKSNGKGYRYIRLVEVMNEHGFLIPYLEDACEHKDYTICAMQDEIIKDIKFGLPYLDGPRRNSAWKHPKLVEVSQECKDIFLDAIKHPKYLSLHVAYAFQRSLPTFFKFVMEMKDVNLARRIHLSDFDDMMYEKSKDRIVLKNNLMATIKPIYTFLSYLFIVLFLFTIKSFRTESKVNLMVVFCMLLLVVHIFFVSTFSNYTNWRYVMRILPLIVLVGSIKYFDYFKRVLYNTKLMLTK